MLFRSAPSNFLLTNPVALSKAFDTGGKSLADGFKLFLDDLRNGGVQMVDRAPFVVGGNLAMTPGAVVYRNELMELIQYTPVTPTVHAVPIVIVPPWINKYYILDLREKNSLIKWAVDQGHTVFCISWVNPDARLAAKTFDDYMIEGPLAALDAIAAATGEREANVVGYCLGGTLLACTLAYMAKKNDRRVASATYLATMVDFAEAGELSIFIDEEQLAQLEAAMNERGYLDGSEMAATFNMLRANDLIWSFVINNYLLGKEPFPFDLLYWNADSTRMPAAMHSFYLRQMYQENRLSKGEISLRKTRIDLTKIKTPTFILATREDHIAPWKSTYAATRLYGGPVRFVLSASGHIAGVVNPPAANKYGHWTNDALPPTPDAWFGGATQKAGSWWPEWDAWIKPYSGGEVAARQPGDGGLKSLGDAPGSYVRAK